MTLQVQRKLHLDSAVRAVQADRLWSAGNAVDHRVGDRLRHVDRLPAVRTRARLGVIDGAVLHQVVQVVDAHARSVREERV